MDALTAFGVGSLAAMLVCYVLESRGHGWTLGFAFTCLLSSIYGFAQGAWPFGVVELFWVVAALRRWWGIRKIA